VFDFSLLGFFTGTASGNERGIVIDARGHYPQVGGDKSIASFRANLIVSKDANSSPGASVHDRQIAARRGGDCPPELRASPEGT